jgi:hypothetical protein
MGIALLVEATSGLYYAFGLYRLEPRPLLTGSGQTSPPSNNSRGSACTPAATT